MLRRRDARRHAATVAAAVLLAAAASPASANMGPAWVVGGITYFVVGIWPVAALEALVLRWRYRVPFGRAFSYGLVGNAVSWVAGLLTAGLLGAAFGSLLPPRWLFYNVPLVTVGVVLLAWVLSALIEWPAYRWAFPPGARSRHRTLRASFLAQTASYVLLVVPALWLMGPDLYSLYRTARLDPSLSCMRGARGWVYYVSRDGGSVRRVRLDGTGGERVASVPAGLRADTSWYEPRMAVLPGSTAGWLNLSIRSAKVSAAVESVRTGRAAPFPDDEKGTGSMRSQAADLRPAGQRAWRVYTGFWGSEGLKAGPASASGPVVQWGLDTPLAWWMPTSATVLPGDRVVWQFGPNILVGSLPQRRVGWLADGQGPVVVLDE